MDTYHYKAALDAGTTLVEGTVYIRRSQNRYVMSGGRYGDHSICKHSSEERIQAHWSGYKANQK